MPTVAFADFPTHFPTLRKKIKTHYSVLSTSIFNRGERMKSKLGITASVLVGLTMACSTPTNVNTGTNNAPTNTQTNSTVNANAPDSAASSSPTNESAKQLESFAREFFSKPIPQKLSSAPKYQPKVAAFRKEGDNYFLIEGSNPAISMLSPYYASSSDELHTILLIEPASATISVIDATIPAVVVKKKVDVSRSDSEAEAQYVFVAEVGRIAYKISESMK
jgi:hypothetical protein